MVLTPRLVGLAKGFCFRIVLEHAAPNANEMVAADPSSTVVHSLRRNQERKSLIFLLLAKHGEIDNEAVVKLAEGFSRADHQNVGTEAGMSAICAERDCVMHEDFIKAVRKLNEAKRFKSSAHYSADFGKHFHCVIFISRATDV